MTRLSASQRITVQDRADVALTLKLYRLVAWSGGLRNPVTGEFLPVVVPR